MPRFKLVCQYDGSNFSGWQSQKSGRTVQDELERVLTLLNHGDLVRIVGSGRTDAGVHALGQVAHFNMEPDMDTCELRDALNGNLPEDCHVNLLEVTDPDFHARFSALHRDYIYRCRQDRYLLDRNTVWYTGNLDLSKLNNAAEVVVGEHDFLSFSKKNMDIENTNCTIFQSQWKESSKIVNYYVSANRFLHHMVRYLVGTMVAMSRGNYTMKEFKELLNHPKHDVRIYRAPAYGLALEHVSYE